MASLGNYSGSALVEGQSDFDPIPEGVYDMEVVSSDVVQTKTGTGQMLKIELAVASGDFTGRRVWTNINIVNQNQQAQEIGQRQLSDLCRACGFAAVPSESEEFHGIPIRVKVKMGKPNPPYEARNEVAKFLAAGDDAPAQQPARQQQTAPQQRQQSAPANAGRPAPAWKKAG